MSDCDRGNWELFMAFPLRFYYFFLHGRWLWCATYCLSYLSNSRDVCVSCFDCYLIYPISTLPEHIHSTILSYLQNYLKTHTQTMETSFHPPLMLVSLLANYPHSHYLPPHWGSHLHTPLYSHSIFWRHGSNVSCAVSCTFVLFAFCFGFKVTSVYHASFY